MWLLAGCLQYDESDGKGSPVEASPLAVGVFSLLLVHAASAVATAAAAGEEEAYQGHEHNVEDANAHTHQEANFILRHLNRHWGVGGGGYRGLMGLTGFRKYMKMRLRGRIGELTGSHFILFWGTQTSMLWRQKPGKKPMVLKQWKGHRKMTSA